MQLSSGQYGKLQGKTASVHFYHRTQKIFPGNSFNAQSVPPVSTNQIMKVHYPSFSKLLNLHGYLHRAPMRGLPGNNQANSEKDNMLFYFKKLFCTSNQSCNKIYNTHVQQVFACAASICQLQKNTPIHVFFCSECNILLAIHDLYNTNICLIVKPETQNHVYYSSYFCEIQ